MSWNHSFLHSHLAPCHQKNNRPAWQNHRFFLLGWTPTANLVPIPGVLAYRTAWEMMGGVPMSIVVRPGLSPRPVFLEESGLQSCLQSCGIAM